MAAIIGVVWMYLFLGGGGYGGGPPPDTGEYGGGPPPDTGGYGGGPPPDTSPRVAVCFFGLTRSLRWTLPSVRHRLLDVLRESGMSVDTFVHTYDLKEVCTSQHFEVVRFEFADTSDCLRN